MRSTVLAPVPAHVPYPTQLSTSLTKQELFNYVTRRIYEQGQTSVADVTCAYRGESIDGQPLMCAVGALIPDQLYNPDMEHKIVDDSPHPTSGSLNKFIKNTFESGTAARDYFDHIFQWSDLLYQLQCDHDCGLDPEFGVDEWRAKWLLQVKGTASDHELVIYPELYELEH